jgi:hypothetical protein
MPTNTVIKTKALIGWIVVVASLLTSLSCRAAMSPSDPTRIPTKRSFTTQTSVLPLDETASPTLSVTATPPPPGTVINVTGVVQEIHIEENLNIIVVDGVRYQVPAQIMVVILQRLHHGAVIEFTGKVDEMGVIIIINVVKIDHIVIVINPHGQEGDDDDEDEDD